MKVILFDDTGCRFALLLVSSPPEMEMQEIKQLRDYDLMDSIFFFFSPQLYIGLKKNKIADTYEI